MSDLIDRQDLINGIYNDNPKDVLVYIAEFPSAEPEKGAWIEEEDGGFVECPFCHTKTQFIENIEDLRFCFYCGADMRGEET